jgi:HEPN domain-containing protein
MAGPSADDLKALAQLRLREAQVLLENGHHSGAYYLCGYAVECALKAIIAYSFRAAVIPSKELVNRVYTHKLEELLILAGLNEEKKKHAAESAEFLKNWAIVVGWSEATRYELIDPFKSAAMMQAISDEKNGVLPWLKSHWGVT